MAMLARLHHTLPCLPRVKTVSSTACTLVSSQLLQRESNWSPDKCMPRAGIAKRDKGLLETDILLFPIHSPESFHWWLVTADLRAHRISIYDSGGHLKSSTFHNRNARNLKAWLLYEVTTNPSRRNLPSSVLLRASNIEAWPVETHYKVVQRDGNSCGKFMCLFALCVALDIPTQTWPRTIAVVENMPETCRRLQYAILMGELHVPLTIQVHV